MTQGLGDLPGGLGGLVDRNGGICLDYYDYFWGYLNYLGLYVSFFINSMFGLFGIMKISLRS